MKDNSYIYFKTTIKSKDFQARVSDDFKFGESSIKDLPYETVLEVEGQVMDRGKDANSQMETGEIEVSLRIF